MNLKIPRAGYIAMCVLVGWLVGQLVVAEGMSTAVMMVVSIGAAVIANYFLSSFDHWHWW